MDRRSLSPFYIVAPGLLVLAAISYGFLVNKLGFYWDDWTIAWYLRFLGPESFKDAYALDRPLLAWVYQLTTPILGITPLNWQIFAILTRCLTGCALWWALHGIWPQKTLQTTAIAALFLLYPGFQQQYIAITYGNAFIILSIYLLSWGLLFWGLRRKRLFMILYPISLLTALYTVFTAEHFFGLELLRPVLIWLVLKDETKQGDTTASITRRGLLVWLPFLAIDSAFLAWRLVTPTPRAEITLFSLLQSNPIQTLIAILKTVSQDVYEMGIGAWFLVVDTSRMMLGDNAVLRNHLLIVLAAAAVSLAVLLAVRRTTNISERHQQDRKFGILLILLGLLALLVAGIPIWPTNLRITLYFPYDRFTLPGMFGASLLLVGLIETISFIKYQNILLFSLICGLSAGFHYQNALSFRQDWLAQRDFFWQLNWRMPEIQPGTVLLTSELPFKYDWDNSLTAPLNWNYAPDYQRSNLPYLVYDVEGRMSSGLPALEPGSEIFEEHRITPFNGSTNQAVVFFFHPPGNCINVIASENDLTVSGKPRYFEDIVNFSNPNLIILTEKQTTELLKLFFLPEPGPSWCTYYQKAEKAYQQMDWQEIVRLGEMGLKTIPGPNRQNAYELLPFIEGYAQVGKWQQAQDLALQAVHSWDKLRTPLCKFYSDLHLETDRENPDQNNIRKTSVLLGCELEP
jgi:hypothetical protein